MKCDKNVTHKNMTTKESENVSGVVSMVELIEWSTSVFQVSFDELSNYKCQVTSKMVLYGDIQAKVDLLWKGTDQLPRTTDSKR